MAKTPVRDHLLFLGWGNETGEAEKIQISQEEGYTYLKTPEVTVALDGSEDVEAFKWRELQPMGPNGQREAVIGVARLGDVYLYIRNGVAYMTKNQNVKF